MAYLKVRVPSNITAGALTQICRAIEFAVNNLDIRNFPKPVPGSVIKTGTLPGLALQDDSVPLGKLQVAKWYIPLCLPASAFTTTSTTAVPLGPYFRWNPTEWPSGTWKFEATIYVTNPSATCTCSLQGSSVIASLTTTSTAAALVESTPLSMPTAAENIWITLKTSNARYAAGFLGGRLILNI